jgi:hypothetical protein
MKSRACAASQALAASPLPDETAILNFRHFLEVNKLTAVLLDTINAHLKAHGLLVSKARWWMPPSSMPLRLPQNPLPGFGKERLAGQLAGWPR